MSNCFEQIKKVKIEFEDGSVSVCTLFGKNSLIFEQLSYEIKELKSLIQWKPINTAPSNERIIVLYRDNSISTIIFDTGYSKETEAIYWTQIPELPNNE